MLRLLLALQIFYTVYQSHYAIASGMPGVNVPNVLFLLVLLMIASTPKREETFARPLLRTPLLLFFATLVIGFVIAQVRAPGDFMSDVTYLKNAMFSPLLYFMYLRCRQDEKTTRLLIIATMVVAAVAAVQAIRQGFDYGIGTFVESHRASGPFGNTYRDSNRAGVFYAMFLPMFVAVALLFRGQWRWRTAAFGGIVLLGAAVMFTFSRQAYFIALFGLLLVLLRRGIVFAVVLGVLMVALAGVLVPESVNQRVEETHQAGPHGEQELDDSTTSRWEIWAGAAAMWQANPAGVGLNRFKTEIGHYSEFAHYDAHNFYVLTLAECGPQGLLALLLLVAATLRLGTWLRRTAPPDDAEARALAIGFSVTTLCMAFGNLYGSPFFEGNVMGPYWILCGLLERYMQMKAHAVAQESAPAPLATMRERFPLAARINRIAVQR